ncbi:hypothetical protein KOW79_014462 [Hemibagrus wyckioides]|uniref:Uncharacterized protein n=1 Tax=Hemibagrus wyckioides TaxID=337641 RepID=A0A9D3SJP4_9TELE|nr:hypothetical protein KOW79_014462 [Hemibagrus wyckioides]
MAARERRFHADEIRRGKPTNCQAKPEARFWAEMIATIRWPIILQIVDERRVKDEISHFISLSVILFVSEPPEQQPGLSV